MENQLSESAMGVLTDLLDKTINKVYVQLALIPSIPIPEQLEGLGVTEALPLLASIAETLSPTCPAPIYPQGHIPVGLEDLGFVVKFGIASQLTSSDCKEMRQVPALVCDLLRDAIFKIINGESSEKAFGLKKNKKGGRPCSLSLQGEMLVANLVFDHHKIMEYPLEKACFMVVECLEEHAKSGDEFYKLNPNMKSYGKFNPCSSYENIIEVLIKDKTRDDLPGQIKNYYNKHKNALQKIWDETWTEIFIDEILTNKKFGDAISEYVKVNHDPHNETSVTLARIIGASIGGNQEL